MNDPDLLYRGKAETAVVLRPLGLGDLLTGVPAIRGIRAAVPDHRTKTTFGVSERAIAASAEYLPTDEFTATWKRADALKVQKGEWAIVEEKPIEGDPKSEETKALQRQASNRASLIKNGRLAPFRPAGVFTAASRTETTDSGSLVVRVYAMYQGEAFAKPPKEVTSAGASAEAPSAASPSVPATASV